MSTCQPRKLMLIDDTGRQNFNQHLLQYIADHDDISIETFLSEINEKSGISSMVDAFGKTLLHYAIECKNETITETLIDSGCDIHAVDNVGQTPLLIALEKKYMNILHLLARNISEVYIDEDIGRNWLRIILADSEWDTRTSVALFPKMKVKSGGSTELANILMAENCDLRYAICMKNSAVIKTMIDQGWSLESKDMKGTALHYAVTLGFTENVKLLLERGVNINVQDESGDPPLFWAIHAKHSEYVKILLEIGANVNVQNEKGNSALHIAVYSGQVEIIKLLLEHNANVNAQNEDGDTPLHIAAHSENLECVELLLERHANASTLNVRHCTPLHMAVYSGSTEKLKLILEHGVDRNITDAISNTALHLAASLKQAENVKLLLEYNANENTQNEKGSTPLHLAAHFGPTENVNLLLERGANADVKDNNGNTALHFAARIRNSESIKLLLDHGVDVNVQDGKGNTALHFAVRFGNSESIKLLLDHGADVNVQDGKGNTALHLAARFKHFETAKLLLEHGANVNVRNSKHKIAMNHTKHMYRTVQQQKLLKLLVDNGSDLSSLDKKNKWQMCSVLKYGPKEAVEILLNTNEIFLVRSHTGRTVAHYLVENSNPGVYELLYTRDFDVNARDQFGLTPLHLAAKATNEVACRVLLDKGAEVNSTGYGSLEIPLVYALLYITAAAGNERCIDLLLERGANIQFVTADNLTVINLPSVQNLPEVTEIVLGHLAMLQFRGTAIIDRIRQDIAAIEPYKSDYELCESQLQKMKTEPVAEGITFFQLLTENERKVAVYMRNKELLMKIQSFRSKYHSNSYCNKQFDKHITDAIQFANLIKEAEDILYEHMKSMIKFNSYIVPEIVRYLNRQDLVNIINM